MAGLPLFKLGILFVRTLAKPVAKQLKEQAAEHVLFRNSVIALGNMLNYGQTQIEVRIMGHVPRKIKPLREEAAVSRGAEFLGESFIFAVAALAVVIEYFRQQSSKARTEQNEAAMLKAKMDAERERDRILERAILRMDARMARVERMLWMADTSGVSEEEQLRRDRDVAERSSDLRKKLEDSRLAAYNTRKPSAGKEDALGAEGEPAEAAAAAAKERSIAQAKDVLSGPTEREYVMEIAGSVLSKINQVLDDIGPLWTSGFTRDSSSTGKQQQQQQQHNQQQQQQQKQQDQDDVDDGNNCKFGKDCNDRV